MAVTVATTGVCDIEHRGSGLHWMETSMIPHMLGCMLVVSLATAAFTPAAQANINPREQLAPRQDHGGWADKLRNTPITKQPTDQEYKEVGKPGRPHHLADGALQNRPGVSKFWPRRADLTVLSVRSVGMRGFTLATAMVTGLALRRTIGAHSSSANGFCVRNELVGGAEAQRARPSLAQ